MEQNTIEQMEQIVEQLLAKAEELKQQIEAAKKEEDIWPKKLVDKYWVRLYSKCSIQHGIVVTPMMKVQ